MKKVVYILLTTIICFFVLPTSTKASEPAKFYSFATTQYRNDQVAVFYRGEIYSFNRYATSGFYYHTGDGNFAFGFDSDVFELIDVTSKYNYKYDNGQLIMDSETFINNSIETVNGRVLNFNEPGVVYTVMLKVKENAKIGNTKVDGLLYEIVCSDTDIQNGVEGCTPNEEKNEVDNTLNNNTDNNSNNAMENSSNKNIILDDIKFYILAGLICVTIIEMLVLIIRSRKKIN